MRGLRLGRVFGIPVQLNWTFLLILPIFAWVIGSDIDRLTGLVNSVLGGSDLGVETLTAGLTPWLLGGAAAVGLFAGVLLHELGHSLVAMRYNVEIESITLWLLGGVASFKRIPEVWQEEFTIAIAGPLVSVAVGGLSYLFSPLMILLAFFIYIAASGEAQQSTLKAAFEGVTVGDIMTPKAELHVVDPKTTITNLLGRMVTERHTGYPVVDARGELLGVVTQDHARSVTEVERDAYTAADVMNREVPTVTPTTEAIGALRTIQEQSVGRLPVVDSRGELVGIVSKADLMTAFNLIQSRGEATGIVNNAADSSFPPLR